MALIPCSIIEYWRMFSLIPISVLPAFWVGLLYDEDTLQVQAILDLTADWTQTEREMLRNKVPVTGLKTPFRDSLLKHVVEDVLKLAKDGLERRGYKEAGFLNAVAEVVRTEWGESVDPVCVPGTALLKNET
ncbi:unnamed protein product [Cochlearia groenlandica]